MPEIEIHAEHGEQHSNPLVLPVSLTISILAVLVAAVALMGHRVHTEELLRQSQASDQWAYFQAKNIRLHEMQTMVDLLGVLAPHAPQETELLREKYQAEVQRYSSDKDDISDKAKEFESERDLLSRRADRFDAGEGILEIALVICSITLLTDKKAFWYVGILIGGVGIVAALAGFLVH